MKYPPSHLAELSDIEHSYHRVMREGETGTLALIVCFRGDYSDKGKKDDASFMTAIAAAGLEAWDPNALVLDLRELRYSWGDWMQKVLNIGCGRKNTLEGILLGNETELKIVDLPTVVVASELCRDGLESLIREEMHQDPARWLFDTLESALSAVTRTKNI